MDTASAYRPWRTRDLKYMKKESIYKKKCLEKVKLSGRAPGKLQSDLRKLSFTHSIRQKKFFLNAKRTGDNCASLCG